MHKYAHSLRLAAMVALVAISIGLLGSTAYAADAVRVTHRILKDRILHDAGDRFDVRFTSTHVDKTIGPQRRITGTGRFRRRGKTPQRFTYHSTVNVRSGVDMDTGYDIQ